MSQLDSLHIEAFAPSSSSVKILGRHFIDDNGRIVQLRGANVSASSKVPTDPKPLIHESAGASYVNRPFPISEAPEHWKRLRSWGSTFVRITVTWDAIEHAGPGQYDEEYLAYLRDLLASMKDYGLACYVAIHQDVWSRYCGGSGAPGWTLTKAGFDLSDNGDKLVNSGAAFLDGIKGGRLEGERGLWPTGYQKLAAASMNTFFWGGETFAPKLLVDTGKGKKNIQAFLQDTFLAATSKLVKAVGDLDTVLGFEMWNEPHPGYIGLSSIHEWNYNTDLHLGDFPSPLQSFSMGAGHKTARVPHYTRSFPFPTRINRYVEGNPTETSAWTIPCPFQEAGAWRWSDAKSKPIALQEDYFTKDTKGKKIDFYSDFFWPFVRKWEATVKAAGGKSKLRMVEPVPNEFCPEWPEDLKSDQLVYAPHWYDLNALFKKQMGFMTVNVQGLSRGMFVLKALYFGKGIKDNYKVQIRNIVRNTRQQLGEVPIVFGECGVPMDLNNEEALKTGDWKWQERMMDAMISAFEATQVGFNLWNYNPANSDETGDDWNAENFSFFSDENRQKLVGQSPSDHSGPDAGGRLLDAIVRPYAIATAGTPIGVHYNMETSLFTFRYLSKTNLPSNPEAYQPDKADITEIFVPSRTFKSVEKLRYQLSLGGKILFDLENDRAYVWFIDTAYSSKGKVEQHRRVDIWVPEISEREGDGKAWWQWLLYLLVLAISLWVGRSLQVHQWRTERLNDIQVLQSKFWF